VKLGVVVVAAVAVGVVTVVIGVKTHLPLSLLTLIAGLLALASVQLLARGMTSPLREMAAAAAAMAKGEYGRRVTATSRDEVGELARAFNQMAAELAEVDTTRRDLIANVSHELRTPISALQAVLENLVDGVESPDPQSFKIMLAQVERLGRLVTQLLDLSRLESGVVPLQKTTFELAPLLEQAIFEARLHEQRRDDRRVSLDMDVAPQGLNALADPERVHQVVTNLLENAMRHSPEGGHVMLSARAEDRAVLIEVSDEGPGIPAAEASRVFERFYRSDAARSSRDGGTGLGLAIARWIVDLHGGQIAAEQARPHGCRMVVRLPT
jgi:signal transduction histidine kinase